MRFLRKVKEDYQTMLLARVRLLIFILKKDSAALKYFLYQS